METQNEESGSRYDTLLLIVALLLLAGGMAVYYMLEPQLSKLPRMAIMLGGIAAAVALVYQTAIGKTLWGYVLGSRVELRKVVWPSRQETLQTTLVIAVFVAIMAVLMWGLDTALLYGVQQLTGRA
jgi:preprotein translocase subunit SecE